MKIMGTWNVRILHAVYPDGEHELFPAEVHYSDNKANVPTGYASFSATGDSLDDIRFYASELMKACDLPILESGDAFPLPYVPLGGNDQ